MSIHPNVVLMAVLTPDNLSRKTMRLILGKDNLEDEIKIGENFYTATVMESEFDEDWQISAKEGDLVFHGHATYGYGEVISWHYLEARKKELEIWADRMCKRFNCSYVIQVTADYF